MTKSLKYIMLFFISVSLISICRAKSGDDDLKEGDVPQVIKASLKSIYPGIYVYDWEYNKRPEYYRAKFVFKGDQFKVYFDRDGKIFKTEQKLIIGQLPATVANSFSASKYSAWEVKEIRRVTEIEVTYVFKIKNDKKRELTYDSLGKLIGDEKD